MGESLAQELRVESAAEHPGTTRVGRYKMLISGDSVGGLVPKDHARALGLLDVGETEVFINYELGVVMHKIPEVAGGDGDG